MTENLTDGRIADLERRIITQSERLALVIEQREEAKARIEELERERPLFVESVRAHVCLCDYGEGDGDCHQAGDDMRCPTCAACATEPSTQNENERTQGENGC